MNNNFKPFIQEEPISRFLGKLFSLLEAKHIHYAVLRNYAPLPHSLGGSDLDILVQPDDENKARMAVANAINNSGGGIIGYSETPGFLKIFTFGYSTKSISGWWGLQLDIFIGLRYAGAAVLLEDNVLSSHCHRHNDINVLSEGLASTLGVMKELLHNDLLPERYLSDTSEAISNDWTGLCKELAPVGKTALGLFRHLVLSSSDKNIIKESKAFRRSLLRHAFYLSPFSFIKNRFLFECSKVRRFIKPPGLLLAVLGTDGAGKSTIISAISPVLIEATHGAFHVQHLRPSLLPPLARLKGRQAQQEGPVTNPHGSTQSGTFGSLLRIIYLLIDYVIGYWVKVRPKIARSPAIILFDRYAYDMSLDQRRFRIKLPTGLVQWLTRLAPKPDLIICLYGDPEIIAHRKKELPLNEVKRQTQALLEFARNEPRAVLVSTEGTIEQSRDDVLNTLLDFCKSRTQGSLERAL